MRTTWQLIFNLIFNFEKNIIENFGGTLSDALESTTGARCICVSGNGAHLACGGCDGNIYIFDLLAAFSNLNNSKCEKFMELEAHNNEILCLDYSDPLKCILIN